MHPAPRTRAGRSVFSMFAVQAALTAVFGLVNSGMAHGAAARNIAIAAAVLCLAVGLVLRSWPSSATWMLALGFEVAFIMVGVAVFAAWHVYMVGTLVAIANVVRLRQGRASFAAPQAAVPGYGQPPFPSGYGQQGYGQPYIPQGYSPSGSGQPPHLGQPPYPGPQSPPPEDPSAQHLPY